MPDLSAHRHGGLGRRRQVDADRAPAAGLQAAARRPRRGRPRARHRRPAGRARAGHHDRRRLPLLRHRAALVHPRRHAGACPLHAQHGHRRVDRGPRAGARGRAQGAARAVAPPRLSGRAARHPPPRGVREQDGPGRVLPRPVRGDRDRVRVARGAARDRRRARRADQRAARRQRGRRERADALVRRPDAARAARDGRGRPRPRRRRRPLPRAVDGARRRLPRLRRPRGRRRAEHRRRGDRAPARLAHPDRAHRHARRARSRRRPRRWSRR